MRKKRAEREKEEGAEEPRRGDGREREWLGWGDLIILICGSQFG